MRYFDRTFFLVLLGTLVFLVVAVLGVEKIKDWSLDNAGLLNGFATLALTGALVYFTWRLTKVTHLLYLATQDAASAAKTSAKNEQIYNRGSGVRIFPGAPL